MTDHIPSVFHDISANFGPWALDSEEVHTLVERGQRAFDSYVSGISERKLTALEAYRAARVAKSRKMGVRGKVGILYVEGPLVKRESWITGLLGMHTYETLRQDLQVALDDPDIRSILLNIDSPGGEVHGCGALADAIYDARGKKPITAYVGDLGCSAAYWIASAAERIVASPTAMLGSIGVVLEVTDTREADKKNGIHRIISTQSPKKRPDPATRDGHDQIVKMLDDMAKVFIAKVARNRGVSTETVLSKFGAGGVLIGAKAVKAGMADEVGHFETALAKMQSQAKPAAKASAQAAATTVSAPSFGASASSAEYRPVAPQPTAEEQARAAAVARAKRQEEIDASWRRAAARTNAGLNLPAEASADDETAGAEPAKPPLAGWQKAAAEANKRFGNI